uniref:Uncharacterized protein n=2 Tax=Physcomitrium patens TaxID=3218 RepID=A0A2K1J9F1_PHYPA|nr:LRR receptor-like serine/threonine-protein kinase [Physcomitrium patens]PNR38156.1 hypothetical protein PHYPA_021267 [Physcomitrium patens]|eukprot:XP_024397829.1 LRR receptor-like serine/threonine-protein kinase [Physcomitrella patens]
MEKRAADVVRRGRFNLLCWFSRLAVLCQCAFALNEEGQLLLEWKQGLEDMDNFLDDWNPNDATPCLWAGVYCNQKSISAINFTGFNSLASPLTSETFGRFSNLRVLNVGNTNPYGDFPRDIVNCSKLVSLNLSWTYIWGNVPADISNLRLLQHMDLSYAYFNGTLVNTIGNLRKLRTLSLQCNYFGGSVPESISSLKKFEVLTLGINMWTGKFPSSIFTLPNLGLLMGDDKLDMMPMPDLTYWVNMGELRLYNVNLAQALFPMGVKRMSNLVVLQLSGCNLTGPIPEFLHNLTHLEVIDLDRNSLSGDVPDVFGGMTNLKDFSVQCNRFTGRLPSTT